MTILPKAIYVFNKIPMTFCKEIKISILKYTWKYKRFSTTKEILSKKFNTRGITIPNFKLYCRAITIKIAWDWYKNTQEEKWIRREDPEINPCIY
jgi:hypothetical protein